MLATLRLLWCAALLAACSANSTSPAPSQTPPAANGMPPQQPAPAPGPAAPAPGPKISETCGDGDRCGEGECVTYYGFAGPRGPQFKSCEIRCTGGTACPDGRTCMTIADGPGQVCR